jgi:hypothetical protein
MQKLRSNAVRRVTMVFLDAVAGTNVQTAWQTWEGGGACLFPLLFASSVWAYFSDFTSTFEFRPLLSYFSRRDAGRESGVETV